MAPYIASGSREACVPQRQLSPSVNLYFKPTLPFLRASSGDVVFLGAGGPFLIGPEDERWDRAMLVRQTSVAAFLAFASHDAYLAGLGHRAHGRAAARRSLYAS